MKDDPERQLEALARTVTCDKDFACLRAVDGASCAARDIGMEHNILCLEKGSQAYCRYGTLTALGRFCHCPVRVHVERRRGR